MTDHLSNTISGYCYTLGSGVIFWWFCKQYLVANSTCYAEYIVLYESLHKAIFLWQLLDCLAFPCCRSTPIHCDNNTTTCLAEDQVLHSKVKHIRVKLYSIQDNITFGNMQIVQIHSKDNLADILMKPLGCNDFLWLHGYLGIHHFSTPFLCKKEQHLVTWANNQKEPEGSTTFYILIFSSISLIPSWFPCDTITTTHFHIPTLFLVSHVYHVETWSVKGPWVTEDQGDCNGAIKTKGKKLLHCSKYQPD